MGHALAALLLASPVLAATAPIAVYGGYYDTHHHANLQPKPSPWQGDTDVVFVAQPDSANSGWDTSAIRVDNLGTTTLSGVVVTCDIGTHHYALWGTNSIPAGGHLILAQMGLETFDGSDTNPAGCETCNSKLCLTEIQSTVPVIHVTVNGTTVDYPDTAQILNTHGVDAAGCPYTGTRNDESEAWQAIASDPPGAAVEERAPLAGWWLGPPGPNPSRGRIAFRFAVPHAGPVSLACYDVAGRLLRTWLDGVLEPGEYQMGIELEGRPAGVYYLRLAGPGPTLQRAFALMR